MPKARFNIPATSKPLWKDGRARMVTGVLWQTNYSDSVTLPVYVNYLWNRLMSPTFEYRFCSDDECKDFVQKYYPGDIADAYSKLQVGAARADFWRVLVWLKEGGIYVDIDAAICWPPELLLVDEQSELLILKDVGITNYFMASAPGNLLMKQIADRILLNIQENKLKSVFDMTGPTVVDAIANREGISIEHARLVCRQGQFTSKRFQYADKVRGHWGYEQKDKNIIG